MKQIVDNIKNEFLNYPSDKFLFTRAEVIAIINNIAGKVELPTIQSNGIIANPINSSVTINEVNKVLPKKEFLLLYYLMDNKNKIMRRDKILNDIWGNDVVVNDRTIDVHIRRLREVVGKEYLQTRKCFGYGWFEK